MEVKHITQSEKHAEREGKMMKNGLKRTLSFLMILALLVALVPAAFAEGDDDWDDYGWDDGWNDDWNDDDWNDDDGDTHPTGLIIPEVSVYIPTYEVPMDVGDRTSVSAFVEGADSGASYDWYCSDPSVVSIKGSKETVSLTAKGPGEAEVSLTVTRGDGLSSDYDYFCVTVSSASTPVSVSGGGDIVMEEGESKKLSASASGGSGSYTWDWEVYGDAGLSISDSMRGNVEVYAGRAGSGMVILTVYDAEDSSNNDTVAWYFEVDGKQTEPLSLEMDRGSVDLGPGASGTLRLAASGGSGSYEYVWASDNPGIVSVSGNGATADIYATDTLLPGVNSAEISAFIRDKNTGLSSNTVSCIVTVSGGSTIYNAFDVATVGDSLAMSPLALEIDSAFRGAFGSGINYSASVKFESPNNSIGSLRLQDNTAVRSGTSYSYASFQDMFFAAGKSGEFSTYYMITDGGNSIYGTLSVSVDGGIPVTDASLSSTSMKMALNSNQYLTLTVSPSNASYYVDWSVSNSNYLTVAGSGNKVTLKSGSRTGSATVTATITDFTGISYTRTCNVTVYDDTPPYDPDVYYDPSITVMLGSDYYGSKLADAMTSKFKSSFNLYPADGATIVFTSFGNSRYGTMYLKNGSLPQTNKSYSFRDWVDMYFVPSATGTYSIGYQLSYKGSMMRGTISVIVQSTSLNVTLAPGALQMAPYSSQYVSLGVEPASASYRVTWSSSDKSVATVSGSNSSAVVNSVGTGTATIYATVTDSNGIDIRRGCTVVVSSAGSVFNPTVSTMLGIPYVGTDTSTAMRSQFQALYGTALADSAVIRFASAGNTEVGVMRLADGSMIRPNTDYTLTQYVAMYTQPVTAGTYSVPYTLSYAGKTLNGTVSVIISSASISTDIALTSRAAYWFSDPLSSSTGGSIFADSIRNTVGTGWSYIRFGKVSDGTGTLYQDKVYTGLSTSTNVTPAMLSQLYFVPGDLTGTFSAPYTVYSTNSSVLATGTLNINTQGISFTDVAADAYYAPAVSWAVGRGVTSGTGGTCFSPGMTVTRGQAVTFLWRAAGQPKALLTNNPFTDVPAGAYYYDAVLWAVQQGITNGTSETTFGPDLALHRDQLLTFLCRANGGYAGGDNWSGLAVEWASTRGLLAGIPGDFVAGGDCPRSDVVYYLWKNYNG